MARLNAGADGMPEPRYSQCVLVLPHCLPDIPRHSRESGNPEGSADTAFPQYQGFGFRPRIKYGVTFFRRNDGRAECWFN